MNQVPILYVWTTILSCSLVVYRQISTLLKFGNQRLFLDNLEEQIQLMLNSTNEDVRFFFLERGEVVWRVVLRGCLQREERRQKEKEKREERKRKRSSVERGRFERKNERDTDTQTDRQPEGESVHECVYGVPLNVVAQRQEQNTSDEKEAAEDSQAITNRNLLLQLRSVATQARRMLTPA